MILFFRQLLFLFLFLSLFGGMVVKSEAESASCIFELSAEEKSELKKEIKEEMGESLYSWREYRRGSEKLVEAQDKRIDQFIIGFQIFVTIMTLIALAFWVNWMEASGRSKC